MRINLNPVYLCVLFEEKQFILHLSYGFINTFQQKFNKRNQISIEYYNKNFAFSKNKESINIDFKIENKNKLEHLSDLTTFKAPTDIWKLDILLWYIS